MDINDVIIRIKQARDKANLSARELSLRLGKNSSYITKLEAKEFEPSMKIILDIIEACELTPEYFFYNKFTEYKQDKELLNQIKNMSKEKKELLIKFLNLDK